MTSGKKIHFPTAPTRETTSFLTYAVFMEGFDVWSYFDVFKLDSLPCW